MYSFWVFLSMLVKGMACRSCPFLISMLITKHWANATVVIKHYPPIALMINRHIFRFFIRMDKVSAFIRFGRVRMYPSVTGFAHVDKV